MSNFDGPGTSPTSKVTLRMRFSHAHLPPVRDALVLGKRAPVGKSAVVRSMEAISPGDFRLVSVEHPVIDSVLVREIDLRKVSEEILIREILRHAGPVMDATDALHVEIDLELEVRSELELRREP